MLDSIRKRLTLLFSGSFFFVLVLILIGVYVTNAQLLNRMELNQLKGVSDRDIFERIEHGEDQFIQNPIYFQLLDDSGNERYESLPPDVESKTLRRFLRSDDATKQVDWDDRHFLLYQRSTEEGRLLLMKDISPTEDTLQRLIAVLAGIAVLATIVLTLVGYILAGRAVIPVQQAFDRQRRFTSDASHELRTPLTIVYSGIELLEAESLSNEGRTILEDIKAETASMQYLVSDLLLLAREGQLSPKQEVDLSSLVQKTVERFQHAYSDRIIHASIAPDLHMKGDAHQLNRLLTVFLENALVYSDKVIDVSLEETTTERQLTIQDRGIGIASDQQTKIFERFYRGDHSRHGTGTGLGLSIAQSIVDQHGGTISIDSTLGEGTRFIIHFPTL
ncbi:HAMP domain-containing sensor histidine kinase [Exiguobacterium acetylicum]|uniref:sensor histidine kinase n=1 Tax=Exiguobacterium acetylicum TaxID=41170 RepID=UPI0027E1E3CA|nr:HAMP domain-containing sensor histidine kinase [Exiguobacterium acetylicum]MDQ6468433.1 HAMP domain-containing sensor histidine kinase [Exiguobacterium acetylicum]